MAADLGSATDDQVLRVLSLIDALPTRGRADALLEPLRPRLAALRPTRRMTLTRLLYVPLDPVIVSQSAWAPGSGLMPRTVLQPMAAGLLPHLPDAAQLDKVLETVDAGDDTAITRIGARLWPEAAALVDSHPMLEADWLAQTGLPGRERPALCALLRLVWEQALNLRSLDDLRNAPERLRERLDLMLDAAAQRGPQGWSVMLALLFAQAGEPGAEPDPQAAAGPDCLIETIIDAATEFSYGRQEARMQRLLESGLNRAIDQMLDRMTGLLGNTPVMVPIEASRLSRHLAQVTVALESLSRSASLRPDQMRRVEDIRRSAAAGCRERFTRALREDVIEPLQAIAHGVPGAGGDPEEQEQAIDRIETRARALRRFEAVARRLGEPAAYDACLAEITALLIADGASTASGPAGLAPVDRLRLGEIVLGTQAAASLVHRMWPAPNAAHATPGAAAPDATVAPPPIPSSAPSSGMQAAAVPAEASS